MKRYDEERMKTVRARVEEVVLSWPGVAAKRMFGCPSYVTGGTLFAFLVTDGIVLTNLPDAARVEARRRFGAVPFESENGAVKHWCRIPLKGADDLAGTVPAIRKSYSTARGTAAT